MKNKVSWSWSSARLVVVIGISVGLAIGVGGAAGCSVEPVESELAAPVLEEEVPAGSLVAETNLQIIFQCFNANDIPVGLPKSTLAACRAACPVDGYCLRCIWNNNAGECP